MTKFTLHTADTAPEASKPVLQNAQKELGFVPNLYAHLAESAPTLSAYKQLSALLEQSAFSPVEQQVVLLATSVENHCAYCVAAHSMIARNMAKAAPDIIAALREGKPLPNPKLEALSAFTKAMVNKRGWVADSPELAQFFAAGYSHAHALEVILGVAMKTISNYSNHLTGTPLDDAFADEIWRAPTTE